jgi:hypothetical protein
MMINYIPAGAGESRTADGNPGFDRSSPIPYEMLRVMHCFGTQF